MSTGTLTVTLRMAWWFKYACLAMLIYAHIVRRLPSEVLIGRLVKAAARVNQCNDSTK